MMLTKGYSSDISFVDSTKQAGTNIGVVVILRMIYDTANFYILVLPPKLRCQ